MFHFHIHSIQLEYHLPNNFNMINESSSYVSPHEDGLEYGHNSADIAADNMAAHIFASESKPKEDGKRRRLDQSQSSSTSSSSSSSLSTAADAVCYRCGRSGHWALECYARTHIDGHQIEGADGGGSSSGGG